MDYNLPPKPPSEFAELVDGVEDIITPEVEKEEAFFAQVSCTVCGGPVSKVLHPVTPFKTGAILPNFVGKCQECGATSDPHTGLVLSHSVI